MISTAMSRALVLARRGLGKTSPNPMVGAVVVDDQGHILAEGYHHKAGRAHAERIALEKAGDLARGQTLYVTLEPCNHTGRTPPCTEAIIQAGIRRVIVATPDPNPRVTGGGLKRLREAGLIVQVGDGGQEAELLNQAFFTWSRLRRPFVTLKAAMTLDGKVASGAGESKYLTSEASRAHAHDLRRIHDAILVGSGTILADNPSLTYRGRRPGQDPVRVVLDTRGRIPAESRIFHTESKAPTLVFTTETASRDWERDIFSVGGEVVPVATDATGHLRLEEVLEHLADRHVLSLLVEGGPTVHASFVEQNYCDRWVSYLAPLILGGTTAPSAVGGPGFNLTVAPRFHIERVLQRGPDVIIEAALMATAAEPSNRNEVPHVYGNH